MIKLLSLLYSTASTMTLLSKYMRRRAKRKRTSDTALPESGARPLQLEANRTCEAFRPVGNTQSAGVDLEGLSWHLLEVSQTVH